MRNIENCKDNAPEALRPTLGNYAQLRPAAAAAMPNANLVQRPLRDEKEDTWDVKVYDKDGVSFVDSKSGGLSLFNYRNPKFGNLWWRIPASTKLPSGLHISLDKGGKEGKFHFTIRPLQDMPYYLYIEKLKQLESAAIPSFLSPPKSEVS